MQLSRCPFLTSVNFNAFWDDLNISIDRALDVNKNIVLLGDLNETLFNDSLMNLRNVIFINHLENVFTEPTHV